MHDRVELVAILAAYIRRHGAAGAVLGLEVALGRENQVHHALVEVVIPTDGVIAFKAVREQEVDIAVFGVAKDYGVVIAIAGKEFLQGRTGISQVPHGHDDIFQKRGCTGRARLSDLGIQALAEIPGGIARSGIGREGGWRLQRQLAQKLRALALLLPQFFFRVSVVLNEQCGLLVHIETGDGLRNLVKALAHANRGGVH